MTAEPGRDKWASWLLSRRDGGDDAIRRRFEPELLALRDGVLDRAGIGPGDVVLDVGTGTGLIGFGALDRVGDHGRVVFSDVSADLLATCRRGAGEDPRCAFVQAAADRLDGVADASVDVVTTRSVLIYVASRPAAFAEFLRVLKPGGRLSIFEPINSFEPREQLLGYELGPVADLVAKVRAAYRPAGAEADDPMLNFDERDLLSWARDAGFVGVALDYRAEVDVAGPVPGAWDAIKRTAPNPLVPTYAEAMAETLGTAEQDRLETYIRDLIARGTVPRHTRAIAYLRAVRP